MRIYHAIEEFSTAQRTIVTLGTFDGVHIGHARIIQRLKDAAAETGCDTLLLTFFPHPRMVLQDPSRIRLLNTLDEKASLLEKAGLDHLVVHPFDKDFANLTAEEFVKQVLVDRFHVQRIIIGYDHRFGRNRTADIHDLKRFGLQYDFEVEEIPSQDIDAVSVSSTKIRLALEEGDVAKAKSYLGYEYFLTGTVVTGCQIGRTIGFPTANIEVAEPYKLIPKQGIYVVCSAIGDRKVYGMMSIGTNPTVNGDRQTIEVYYFDFEGDLYGATLSVSFLARIRDEERFPSLEALKEALHRDMDFSRAFIQQWEK
ncbi:MULTISPECIES: bifunctional riboflavin kinase/FAD synthetase [unclassified Flavobacterium]|uniref:bifunctional riboflavin kinase/FAD synthetase n=1 Tax=unclassified Flavobacterium TaxID=196869 RepID=UPI001F14168A|nr:MULTISPECIES: bifunctional riboflavin kinase/FAD synthetase [unclassified Flavobacterium]UMY66581.1 bifunctional riboflavin kinase/FAD synthetase [Flavobacterium sp. HJ-32-4]